MKQLYFFILILIAFGGLPLHAQQAVLKDEKAMQLLNLIGEDSLAQALEGIHLFDVKQFKSDTLVKRISHWLDEKWKDLDFKPRTNLGLSNYFFSNAIPSDSAATEGELFTGIDISSGLNLFGIPIQALGNVTLRNGRYDGQFSDFAIRFDQQSFLKKLKNRQIPSLSWNTLQNPDDYKVLSGVEKKAILQELRYALYKKVMDNPRYRKTKDSLFLALDSLKQQIGQDSSLQSLAARIDTTQQKLQAKIDLLQKLEQKFLDVWAYKSQYQDSLLHQAKNKLQAQRQRLDNWANPKSWQADSVFSNLKIGEKTLIALEDLAIGQFSTSGSDFTLFQMPLQGVQIKMSTHKWYGELASGRQRLQFGFAPSYGRLLFNPSGKKYFNYAALGVGSKEKTHLQLALCEATERNRPNDSIPILNKQNLVWEILGQLSITSNWSLKFSTAFADLELGGNELTSTGNIAFSAAKSAAKFQVAYHAPQSNDHIAIGYFYTGAEFVTLGNPFLRSNWEGISIDGNTSLFHKRIQLKGNAKYGTIQDPNLVNGNSKELQFFGQLNWRINGKSNISLQVLPNRFVQSGYAQEKIEGSQALYQLQWNQVNKLGKSKNQLLSMIGLSNYQFNYQLIDSINTSTSLYGTLQQSLILGSGDGFTSSFTSSTQTLARLDDWLLQFDFTKRSKLFSMKIGLQALQQHWYDSSKMGINLGLQLHGNTKYNFGLNFIYRRPIQGNEKEQVIGNCSFYTTF